MELLAGMKSEVQNDRLTIWSYADAAVGEALELVGGVDAALEGLSIMLEHIGGVNGTPASASG